jgi:hypothetical protein
MRSQPDEGLEVERTDRGATAAFLVWNRRIHYYLGLFLLFVTWLFVFTGLLLNHPRWQFAQFWPNRVQTTAEYDVQPLRTGSDVERARYPMRQLGPNCLCSATSDRRPLQIRQARRQRRSGTCETADFQECARALILPVAMQDGHASRS